MDRSIEVEVSATKKRRRLIIIIGVLLALLLTVWVVRSLLKPSLRSSDILVSKVELGAVENTISASGEVLPEFEEILASPIKASIQEVLLDPGKKVVKGQSILRLDKSATQSEYERLQFQMESKANEISKLRLTLEKSFYDIKSNNSIKELRISNLKDNVSAAQRLLKAGGGTREDVEKASLDLKVAQLEKQQLENEIRSKQQTMKIEIREAEIALAIQQNDLQALKRKLDKAEVVASRDGVVTWVNKNIGASINEGEALVRIANLSSFKVAGSMSDNMLDQIYNAMPAIVRVGESHLRGSIANISPAINNNIVSFELRLDQKDAKVLRPNQKVDVFLVTQTRPKVMRVSNGPAFNGAGRQDIFVLKDGVAERRTVETGLSNFDYIEIKNGLKPGDAVITTDMSTYKNYQKIPITSN
ncbi:ABC transporter permease [Pedobacter quisquiliarum]|uniref:ABC transporter permease n=1 Tax=Pedobacter quisquiliarum TaxID=1834438 RepID=A0A916XAN7_9SPHI|nr:HlyD family efflux transporter periplasmic adaptor subunit [Pedobacter quisquiliarum]GGC57894.1 ABC transporter permease [Pedobacter quisquiliarum]